MQQVLQVSIPRVELAFTHGNLTPWFQLTIADIHFDQKVRPYDTLLALTMRALHAHDSQKVTAFPQYKTLLQSSEEEGAVIHVDSRSLDRRHVEYRGEASFLTVQLSSLEINWNMDLLSMLMNFLQFKGKGMGMERQVVGSLQSDLVLTTVKIELKRVVLNLNNSKDEITVARICVENMNNVLKIKNSGSFFTGSLGNLTIYDMTEWPKTALRTPADQIEPYSLFSIREPSDAIVDFSITILEDDAPEKEDDNGTVVHMHLRGVDLTLLNQSYIRLSNYFTYKVLGALDPVARYQSRNRWPETYQLSIIDIMEPLEYPQRGDAYKRFTSITVVIDDPILYLVPRPSSDEYFHAELSQISVTNSHRLVQNRHSTESVWVDLYRIAFTQMNLMAGDETVIEPFDWALHFERALLSQRQTTSSLDFATHFTLTATIDRLLMNLSQRKFTLLLNLIDLNMAYDDHMEKIINPDSEKAEIVTDDPRHLGLFMNFTINIGYLSMILRCEATDVAEILMVNSGIHMMKYLDYYMELDIETRVLHLTKPDFSESSASEMSLLDHKITDLAFNSGKKARLRRHKFEPIIGRLPIAFLKPIADEEDQASAPPSLTITMKKGCDGTKHIAIHLNQIRMNLSLAILFELQNFFFYGLADYTYASESPFDFMHKYRPRPEDTHDEVENEWYGPMMDMTVYVNQPLIILPAKKGARVLVLQTDVTFNMWKERESLLVLQMPAEVPAVKKVIRCKGLQIYSCKPGILSTLSRFAQLTKRRIVEPTDIEMNMMQEAVGRARRGYHQNHSISQLQIYVSYQDIEQFQEASAYQTEELKRENPIVEALVVTYKPAEAFTAKSLVRQGSLSVSSRFSSRISHPQSKQPSQVQKSDEGGSSIVVGEAAALTEELPPIQPAKLKDILNTTAISFKGVQMILIHDVAGAYSPVLDLCLKQFQWQSRYSDSESRGCTEISAYVNYYNPVGDCWEPFVECSDMIYATITSPGESPETQTLLSLSEEYPLNINITETMLIYLNKVMATWSEPEKPQTGWRTSAVVRKANVEVVVPFVISNEIGYPIMVAKELLAGQQTADQEVLVINPGEYVPYEIESTGSRIANMETENIQILITKDNQCLATISGINIKRCQLLTKQFRHEGKKYSCLFHVFMKGTVKYLSVRSPVMFKNMTAYDVSIRFLEGEIERLGECKAGERCPVPFDMYKDKVQLSPRTMDSSGWPELDLKELLAKRAGHTLELGSSSFVMTLYLDVDKKNKRKISMQLMAPIKIRNSLPCALVIRLSTEGQEGHKEVRIEKGQIHSEHSFSSAGTVYATYQLPNFSESEKIVLVKRRTGGQNALTLRDSTEGKVEISFLHKTSGTHTVIVFVSTVLLNYTCLPVSFYYAKAGGKQKPVAGQQGFTSSVLSNNVTQLVVDLEGHKSEPFNINTVGTQNVVDIETDRNQTGGFVNYQFVYDVQLSWPVPEELIYTKLVSIAPRLIMINFLKNGLFVIQNGSTEQPTLLQPGERAPFYWPDGRFPEFINVRIAERAQDEDGDIDKYRYGWSGAFSVSEIGASTVQCKDVTTDGGFIFIRAEVKLLGLSSIVTFEEENEKYSAYRVENNSHHISVLLYQEGCKDEARWLDIHANTAFAWTQPLKEHLLIVEFYLGALRSCPLYSGQKYGFHMDSASENFKLKLDRTGHGGQLVFCKVCCVGASRVLKVRDCRMEGEESDDIRVIGDFKATIHHFGLSIIENTAEYCNELFYVTFKDILIEGIRTKHSQTYKAAISRLQIDNQYNLMAVFPIVISPQPVAEREKMINFQLTYYLDGNPNVVNFDKCDISVEPIEILIENLVLQRLIAMSYRISLALNTKPEASTPILFRTGSTDQPGTDPAWKSLQISASDKQYYIGRFRIEPIRVLLSFVPLKDIADIDTEAMDLLLSALGMAITNIDQAPLKFFSLELREIYGSKQQISNLIWMHYRTQLASELFTVIGHADILGNPVGLLTDLGNGVVDAIYEPASGLTEGPIGLSKGVVKGAHSLFKNTVSSTFGSMSKISGSLSRGLISITQDDEYIVQRQREKAKYRPKDLVDGIGMGVRSFYLNIGRGVTGVFTEPWKGAKRDGFKGFMYGSARGFSGLFAKPVAGTLDVASKVAEGMMSMAHMFEDSRIEERIRPPRPIYGEAGTIKPYNQQDAEAWFFTSQIDQGKYLKQKFVKQILSTDMRGELILIVVLLKFILMLDVRKKKVIWSLPIEDVDGVDEIEKGLLINVGEKKGNKTVYLVPFPNEGVVKRIAKHIERVRRIAMIYREVDPNI